MFLAGAVRAPSRGLAYSYNSEPIPPGFLETVFAGIFGERLPPRFEDTRKLRNFEVSDAHVHHNFIYTNTREGWFFSPHAEETWFRVLRGFGQFLEGSAMDWQIGDLYDMYNGALRRPAGCSLVHSASSDQSCLACHP